ncbi:hypothetical protein BU24DRAFT_425543 [Aaosphaeria arxii CBS 175.79]|uniref:Uncharacterized protein n=1 Tax=Aaosphaeria arxii CBS 175.79 TaxID=1450172 RepID=A0A6A5XJ97_9PLEO|nr:uncharacterized protein BU24DRAFT_425543 [Aaosphaeria arxii CBS 175.79]KAF2012946.1 hypothetical protein BU24DRAFT_425543 [Aaosphaeria arxii CBS 175.79]
MQTSDWQTTQEGDYTYGYNDGKAYTRHHTATEWTLLSEPTSRASTRKVLGIERASEGPFTWRRHGTPWALEKIQFEPTETVSSQAQERPSLHLVLQRQSEGEPDHWSLFVACEGQKGERFQVTGDAENMYYVHDLDMNILEDEAYKTSFVLAKDLDAEAEVCIKRIAEAETPPSAPNRAAVRENCQGWAYRVVCKLVEEGVVLGEKLPGVKAMIEPIG